MEDRRFVCGVCGAPVREPEAAEVSRGTGQVPWFRRRRVRSVERHFPRFPHQARSRRGRRPVGGAPWRPTLALDRTVVGDRRESDDRWLSISMADEALRQSRAPGPDPRGGMSPRASHFPSRKEEVKIQFKDSIKRRGPACAMVARDSFGGMCLDARARHRLRAPWGKTCRV